MVMKDFVILKMYNKIALITSLSIFDRGGAQAYIKDFINYVNKNGEDKIILISPDKTNDCKEYKNIKLITCLNSRLTRNNKLVNFFFAFLIYLEILYLKYKYNFRYLYSVGIYPVLLVYKYFPYFLPKLVIRPYGYDIQIDKKYNYGIRITKWINDIYKKELKKHKYISISEDVKKELLKLDVSQKNILNSGNSINIDKFSTLKISKSKSNRLRNNYLLKNKLPPNSTIYLTVSSFTPKKRLNQIYEIAKYFGEKHNSNYKHFILLGKDLTTFLKAKTFKNSSINVIDSKNDEDNNINNLSFLYNISNLFVLTSSIETFGRVIIESIFFECIPITYDISGVNKILPKNYQLKAKNDNLKDLIRLIELGESIINNKNQKNNFLKNLKEIPFNYDHKKIIKNHISFIISNY